MLAASVIVTGIGIALTAVGGIGVVHHLNKHCDHGHRGMHHESHHGHGHGMHHESHHGHDQTLKIGIYVIESVKCPVCLTVKPAIEKIQRSIPSHVDFRRFEYISNPRETEMIMNKFKVEHVPTIVIVISEHGDPLNKPKKYKHFNFKRPFNTTLIEQYNQFIEELRRSGF